MDLKKKLISLYDEESTHMSGLTISLDVLIDYVIYVYVRDDGMVEDMTLNQKKEDAFSKFGIKNKNDQETLLLNKNKFVSRVITDLFHIKWDRKFELYISALEAAAILLDVVRRPIDDTLKDEKWLAALRSKKEGFNDARSLIASAAQIAEEIVGLKEVDVEAHVNNDVFKGGIQEDLAKRLRESKK